MATILADKSIEQFKQNNQEISTTLLKWDSPCDEIKKFLTGDVGTVYNAHFQIGRKACEKITKLVEILQEMEDAINKLITDTNTFLDEHSSQNTQEF